MIIGQFTAVGTEAVEAQFRTGKGKLIAKGNFANQAEADRAMYFYRRKCLVADLSKWLKQRNNALANTVKREHPSFLLFLLKSHQFASFKMLVQLVKAYQKSFEICTPHTKSTTYPFFQKEIKPWLDYCYGAKY